MAVDAALTEVVEVGVQDVACRLTWKTRGQADLDLDLSAVLYGADYSSSVEGVPKLGQVDGQLKNHARAVDQQWRECGVRHSGDAPAAAGGKEEISLELSKLMGVDVVELIVITVGFKRGSEAEGSSRCLRDFDDVTVDLVVSKPNGEERLLTAEISKDSEISEGRCAVVAIFTRSPQSKRWYAVWVRSLHSEATTPNLAQLAREKARDGNLYVEKASLHQKVRSLVEEGDVAGAVKSQQAVVQLLTERTPRASERWQRESDQELMQAVEQLDQLQRMEEGCKAAKMSAAGGSGGYPASTQTPQPGGGGAEMNLEQARFESLDEEGYQAVAALKDTRAMATFANRIVENLGGRVFSKEELVVFAAAYSGETGPPKSYDRLTEDLYGFAWVDMPPRSGAGAASSSSAGTAAGANAAAAGPSGVEAEEFAHIQQAREATLDEAGYQTVGAFADVNAMATFLRRVAEANGGSAVNELALSELAADLCDRSGLIRGRFKDYSRLLEELGTRGWTSCPGNASSSAAGPSTLPLAPEAAAASESKAGAVRVATSDTVYPSDTRRMETPEADAAAATTAVTCPLEPRGASVKGGLQVRWVGEGPAPVEVRIGGRPCAALEGSVFIVPMCRAGGSQTVVVVFGDGNELVFPEAFNYWEPGVFQSLEPSAGPITGGRIVRVTTSDLGAAISEVLVDGVTCEFKDGSEATSIMAEVVLPPREAEAMVSVEVRAENSNCATSASDAFRYYVPEAFGLVSERIVLAEAQRKATRTEGVTSGVCISAFPLRRCPEGRYFEIKALEVSRSMKTIAVGVCAKQDDSILIRGNIKFEEAKSLNRCWLAGYDRGGASFMNDGTESKIPTSSWRPVAHVKEGTSIGVLWAESAADSSAGSELVLYQDGEERLRLECGGRLPALDEDLYAVVDVQGSVKSVELVEGATPPRTMAEAAEDQASAH